MDFRQDTANKLILAKLHDNSVDNFRENQDITLKKADLVSSGSRSFSYYSHTANIKVILIGHSLCKCFAWAQILRCLMLSCAGYPEVVLLMLCVNVSG